MFKPVVYQQIRHLHELVRILKYIELRPDDTEMQQLRVEYKERYTDPATGQVRERVVEYSTADAANPAFAIPIIPRDKLIRIYTAC